MKKGDQSCVLIDTLESHEAAQEALVDIKKVINDKPIDAIILTHFHADHTGEFFDHKLCSRGLTSNMKIFIGDCNRNFVQICLEKLEFEAFLDNNLSKEFSCEKTLRSLSFQLLDYQILLKFLVVEFILKSW